MCDKPLPKPAGHWMQENLSFPFPSLLASSSSRAGKKKHARICVEFSPLKEGEIGRGQKRRSSHVLLFEIFLWIFLKAPLRCPVLIAKERSLV